MQEHIKQAIRDHAALLVKNMRPRDDLATFASRLAKFVNVAYELDYPSGSDGYGVLYEACYDAVWEMTRP